MIVISQCETVVDDKKFIESHEARIAANPVLNHVFKDRLDKYFEVKKQIENGQ